MLAAHLGMSVRRAQAEIDSAEFSEWQAFHSVEPFTIDRGDHILATIAAILANVHRPKGAKPYKPDDFMPTVDRDRRDTAESIELKLRALFNGNN